MGKSTVLAMLAQMGAVTLSADEIVHALYRPGAPGTDVVASLAPAAVGAGGVDRMVLSRLIAADACLLNRIERRIHAMVRYQQRLFVRRVAARARWIVLDIPLLFETDQQNRFDFILSVTTSQRLQCDRVMRRPGMTAATFRLIKAKQTPDHLKRCWSNLVVPTGLGRGRTWRALGVMLTRVHMQPARRWQPNWH
jgi:dephospho-CoA kinase